MPNLREILFAIVDEWELQFMNSFIVSPPPPHHHPPPQKKKKKKKKKLNSVTLSTTVLLIIYQGISWVGMSFWWLWKIMNFALSTFSDSLLTISQSDILGRSKLIKYEIWFPSWFTSCVNVHNVLVVSSAYKIKLKHSLTVCISFIYITNNKGPIIEPCGTPVSISFFAEATPSYWVRSERKLLNRYKVVSHKP